MTTKSRRDLVAIGLLHKQKLPTGVDFKLQLIMLNVDPLDIPLVLKNGLISGCADYVFDSFNADAITYEEMEESWTAVNKMMVHLRLIVIYPPQDKRVSFVDTAPRKRGRSKKVVGPTKEPENDSAEISFTIQR